MKILVTGGAGFIGSQVVKQLLAEGHHVRVLHLPKENLINLQGWEVELMAGDITDAGSVKQAVKDCQTVFHLAAIYALWLPNPALMRRVNVEGTRLIFEACLAQKVERVIYTSSIAVFGGQGLNREATENSPFALGVTNDLYSISKFESHQMALDYVAKGLDITIVAPCGPIGPGDVSPTPTGRILLSAANLPVIPVLNSAVNFGDVRDMAAGHLLAAKRGKTGESYLLGNENYQLSEVAALACDILGVRKPIVSAPYALAKLAGMGLKIYADKISHQAPMVTAQAVDIAKLGLRANCQKAFDELQLPRRPLRESLEDALLWFAQNDYIWWPGMAKRIMLVVNPMSLS